MPKYCVRETPVPIRSSNAPLGGWVVHLSSDIYEERKAHEAQVAELKREILKLRAGSAPMSELEKQRNREWNADKNFTGACDAFAQVYNQLYRCRICGHTRDAHLGR